MEVTKPKVEIISHTQCPYDVVSIAARNCYSPMSLEDVMKKMTDTERLKLIKSLEDSKHESPFEHVSITFAIQGISRSCSHQLVRHRIASYSQRSQRYVDEEGFDYIVPSSIENIPIAKSIYKNELEKIESTYDHLKEFILNSYIREDSGDHTALTMTQHDAYEFLSNKTLWICALDVIIKENKAFHKENPIKYKKFLKKACEDARYILPNACSTQIIMTMNVRSLWNFFNLRCCNRAQWEINEVAWEMLRQCKTRWPLLFEHAGPDCISNVCKEKPGMSCGRPPFEKMVEIRNYSYAIDDSDYDDSSEWLKDNPNIKKE